MPATSTQTDDAQPRSAPHHGPRPRVLPEVALAALVVGIAALLIAPLPAPLLDALLALNLALAAVVLLVALSVSRPLSVSAFPAVILVATLLRLALNVSSTRLILGQGYAGRVIDAFASWVVAGSFVVGVVIFLILTVIQFVVIARGGERVAEVAARFALDAMPGRQMAIDADLRAGTLSAAEASRARDRLQRESRLYGAMDGAMKFVKGDAIAGLFILAVDLAGGLAIGLLERDMSAAQALRHYGMLTIGDGLVTQIPALLVAIGAALVVTRVASLSEHGTPSGLGHDIARQLGGQPRALLVAALFLVALALLPGLPVIPFLAIALALGAAAFIARQHEHRAHDDATAPLPYGAPALPPRLTLERPPRATLDADALTGIVATLAHTSGAPLPTPIIHTRPDLEHLVLRIDGVALDPELPADASTGELEARLTAALPALLSMQDVQHLLDRWEEREPALVRALTARRGALATLTRVLRALLAERLPISPLRPILEAQLALPDDAPHTERLDAARTALAVPLARRIRAEARAVLLIGPRIERTLIDAARADSERLTLGAAAQRDIVDALERAARSHDTTLEDAAWCVAAEGRRALEAVLRPHAPRALIVATRELAAAEALGVTLEPHGIVDIGR